MRTGKQWRYGAWLTIGLVVALAVSAVASDETFCVMQHTGYCNLTGGSIAIWQGTNGSPGEPTFALITVTVAKLDSGGTAMLPGGICVEITSGLGGAAAATPDITIKWVDMSDTERTSGSKVWYNSRTFYAKWLVLSGTGQGFYTITFNACSRH